MSKRENDPARQPRAYGPVPAGAVVPPLESRRPRGVRPEHLYKAAGLLFLFALLFHYFEQIVHVLLVAYAAAVLAVALNVIVRLFPAGRRWVTAGIGLVIVGVFLLLLWLGIPALAEQVRSLARELPRIQAELTNWGQWLREQTGLNIGLLGNRSQEYLAGLLGNMPGDEMLGRAKGLIEVLFLPLLILFGALFAVGNPNERLLLPLLRAVPRDHRLAFRRLFELLGLRIRGWVRGTLLAMLAVGTLSTLAYFLLGLRYALLLGVISGLTEFLPLVGPWIGGLVAVVIAFVDEPSKALWVGLAVLVIQQIENNVITPVVMARAAEVHPFVTLFALFLFGTLFGFLGLVLSIPLVLLFWTVVEVLWVERALDTDEDTILPIVEE